jgi:hypothetical protein
MTDRTKIATVPAVFYLVSGAGKLAGMKKSLEIRDRLEMSAVDWRLLGAAETCCGVGVLLRSANRPIGLGSEIGLALISGLAIVNHARRHDALARSAPAVGALLLLSVGRCPPQALARARAAGGRL